MVYVLSENTSWTRCGTPSVGLFARGPKNRQIDLRASLSVALFSQFDSPRGLCYLPDSSLTDEAVEGLLLLVGDVKWLLNCCWRWDDEEELVRANAVGSGLTVGWGVTRGVCGGPGLVINSILFCCLFVIEDLRIKVVSFQTHNQRLCQYFLRVSLDFHTKCNTSTGVLLSLKFRKQYMW